AWMSNSASSSGSSGFGAMNDFCGPLNTDEASSSSEMCAKIESLRCSPGSSSSERKSDASSSTSPACFCSASACLSKSRSEAESKSTDSGPGNSNDASSPDCCLTSSVHDTIDVP